MKKSLRILVGAAIALCLIFAYRSYTAQDATPKLGVDSKGNFTACPEKPNCVNSQTINDMHKVEAWTVGYPPDETMSRFIVASSRVGKFKIVKKTKNYLHLVFYTALFRFPDDLELFQKNGTFIVHLRSASRVGYSDLGTNRKRIETLKNYFFEE